MTSFIRRLFISRSAGRFRSGVAVACLTLFFAVNAQADFEPSLLNWDKFQRTTKYKERTDYINGLSYIISGSIAVVGGQLGQTTTDDPLERGVYTLFQSIGIASIAFGTYTWTIGDEDRLIYNSLKNTPQFSDKDRDAFLQSYYQRKFERERNERFVKVIAHSLIAAFNAYSASQQENATIRNGLYFVGGVNLLAAVSFAF